MRRTTEGFSLNTNDPRLLRETFDAVADRYDRVRPSYEPAIFDDLASLANLGPGARVLEIGCGTGQATIALATRGYKVVAVELGARLATIARRNLTSYPDVNVTVAAFEEWPLPAERFDAVVSATAFHWLDPTTRVSKAAAALKPGGSLAVIDARRRPIADEGVLSQFQHCHETWTSDPPPPFRPHDPSERPQIQAEIEASGLFGSVDVRQYEFTHEYSTAEHHELMLTFSSVLGLDAERRAGLVACIDHVVDTQLAGRLSEHAYMDLVVAHAD